MTQDSKRFAGYFIQLVFAVFLLFFRDGGAGQGFR